LLTLLCGTIVILTFYGFSGNSTSNVLNSSDLKYKSIDEISSLKSLIGILKSEVKNDQTKIEKLEAEIQEIKLDQKNSVFAKNREPILEGINNDENYGIRSSRNKAAIVYKKIDKFQKLSKETESIGASVENSCPAKKLFYSNEGDIQMLHAYEIIPFDNKNGGVWYQGFDIKYDKEKIKNEEKLQVFVVPHSHNDPGWW
jgi:hypothetical protein